MACAVWPVVATWNLESQGELLTHGNLLTEFIYRRDGALESLRMAVPNVLTAPSSSNSNWQAKQSIHLAMAAAMLGENESCLQLDLLNASAALFNEALVRSH